MNRAKVGGRTHLSELVFEFEGTAGWLDRARDAYLTRSKRGLFGAVHVAGHTSLDALVDVLADGGETLEAGFEAAHRYMLERTDHAVAAMIELDPSGTQLRCAHIGDARIYRSRDTALTQMSGDHVPVFDPPLKAHVLDRALGYKSEGGVEVSAHPCLPGDTWIVTTGSQYTDAAVLENAVRKARKQSAEVAEAFVRSALRDTPSEASNKGSAVEALLADRRPGLVARAVRLLDEVDQRATDGDELPVRGQSAAAVVVRITRSS